MRTIRLRTLGVAALATAALTAGCGGDGAKSSSSTAPPPPPARGADSAMEAGLEWFRAAYIHDDDDRARELSTAQLAANPALAKVLDNRRRLVQETNRLGAKAGPPNADGRTCVVVVDISQIVGAALTAVPNGDKWLIDTVDLGGTRCPPGHGTFKP